MALSAIGGAIYANQNMHIPASKQIDMQNRIDLQNSAAAQILNEKDKEIAEVRPTEESYKIDPEKEHEKEKNDESAGEKEQEQQMEEKIAKKQKKESPSSLAHHLDIKV